MSQVSHQTELVVPITLYRIPSQMWTVLRGYKDGYSETERTAHGVRVAATIARFLDVHRACIESVIGEAITLVTTVPSSRGRVGVHPLERAVRRASSISDLYASVLSRGPGEIIHNRASNDGYVATHEVTGRAVLLVEDTFTTGARTQSAATALTQAGATSVAVLAVGRVIDPDWNEACQRIWTERHKFSFDTCCLESR